MNRKMQVQIFALFCTFLTACRTFAAVPTAMPIDTSMAIPAATFTPPPTATPEATVSFLPSGVPAESWQGIPIMPNALAGDGDSTRYAFTIKASQSQVESFYKKKMVQLRWRFVSSLPSSTGATLMFFTKGPQRISVTITPADNGVMSVFIF